MGSIINQNLDKFYLLGVEYLGIFSHVINEEYDLELYIIPSEKGYNYFKVEELIQNIFPDIKVGIYDEEDRHWLGESVIYGIQFC